MKLFYDTIPIIVFFIAYKLLGIYPATAAAIIMSLLQLIYSYLKYKKTETTHWVTFLMISILGGATLILQDEMFIKWKPTVVYWMLGLGFLLSQFIGKKPAVRRMLETTLPLPEKIWPRLNLSWVIFFSTMGALNLYVVYQYDTDTWVNYKLFGTIALTICFVFVQGIFLAKHMPDQPEKPSQPNEPN